MTSRGGLGESSKRRWREGDGGEGTRAVEGADPRGAGRGRGAYVDDELGDVERLVDEAGDEGTLPFLGLVEHSVEDGDEDVAQVAPHAVQALRIQVARRH